MDEDEEREKQEWVAEVRVTTSNYWRVVDEMDPDTVDACHVRIARKQSPYLGSNIEYRIRNVRTGVIIEV